MVSIIIPVYNAAGTVAGALESAGSQTCKDWEIIAVDDCSTDDSAAIVEDWMRRHGELPARLVRCPVNSGPAKARNIGARAASGEWLAFLDADDEWLPGKLEMQMRVMRENPGVAMVCGDKVDISRKAAKPQSVRGSTTETTRRQEAMQGRHGRWSHAETQRSRRRQDTDVGGICPGPQAAVTNAPNVGLYEAEEVGQNVKRGGHADTMLHAPCSMPLPLSAFAIANPVATSTVLLRKSVFEAVGEFDEQFRGPEDYDLWLRVAARYEVLQVRQAFARYRHRDGSLSVDDRSFLPQVMRVIDKAYGPGGVFGGGLRAEGGNLKGKAEGISHGAGEKTQGCEGVEGRPPGLPIPAEEPRQGGRSVLHDGFGRNAPANQSTSSSDAMRFSRRKAMAQQHLSACWMAANRGAVDRAAWLFLKSLTWWPFSLLPGQKTWLVRLKLIVFMARRVCRVRWRKEEYEGD